MWSALPFLLLVSYLPGVVIFRVPIGRRDLRASLSTEERLFWHVILSLLLTSSFGLALAAAGWYRFDRLLWLNGTVIMLLVGVFRGRLRLRQSVKRLSFSALVPAALIGIAAFMTLQAPPAEYIIGGKDPGTYVIEGVQIAQEGSLRITDPLVVSIPEHLLDLYAQEEDRDTYYGRRFMGFYLVEPETGQVVGQFPHLYPVWIAVGYGINGLTGTRYTVTLLAILGVIAVYFTGCWLVGRPAATAAAILLAINVARVWYSRYPNAEILLQILVFAGLLAYFRASANNDRFFAVVAGGLITLAGFTHLTGLFVIVVALCASLLSPYAGRPLSFTFLTVATAGGILVALYYSTLLAPYVERPLVVIQNFPNFSLWAVVSGATFSVLLALSRTQVADSVRRWLPFGVVAGVWVLAAYAYFFRVPEHGLALHDAAALRTFAEYYLSPLGLLMALVGLALVVRKRFWPGLTFVLILVGFSLVFFYKIRIIPEHFWAARRFLAVILPGALLLLGAAAFPLTSFTLPTSLDRRLIRMTTMAMGILVVVFIGAGYLRASAPIMNHVEYEDIVPHIEAINAQISDTDLVIVESRQASDLHTLAIPLAYIYSRAVLVLRHADPNSVKFQEFLSWAKARYKRVLFIGGGGTRLLSPSTDAVPLSTERFSVPEYESAYNAYPSEIRFKRYDVSIFEIFPRVMPIDSFDLDVGVEDELLLSRFHDQEVLGGTNTTFRWSRDTSYVSILGISQKHHIVTLWLQNGGRPDNVGHATVEISLNRRHLGTVTVNEQFKPYRFDVPFDLAAELEVAEQPGLLQLTSHTWKPGEVLRVDDPRELGVMVDRITVN